MGYDVNGYPTRRDADSGKAEMQSTNACTNDASSSTARNKGVERDGQQRGRQLAGTTEQTKERTREGKKGDNGEKADRGRVIGCVKHWRGS
jgi:hypothetical protein